MTKMEIKKDKDNEIKLTIYKHNNNLVIENANDTGKCCFISSIDSNKNLEDIHFVIDIETTNVEKNDDDLYKVII